MESHLSPTRQTHIVGSMRKKLLGLPFILVFALMGCGDETVNPYRLGWSQWGQNAEHTGQVSVQGQALKRILAEVEMDPFAELERLEVGSYEEHGLGPLLVHYQAPLIDGGDIFVESKGGHFVSCVPHGSGEPSPCGLDAWDQQIWREEKWAWSGDKLTQRWIFESDWKPVPSGYAPGSWEPVFHAALYGESVLVPGAAGSLWIVDRDTGKVVRRISPLENDAAAAAGGVYTVAPVTVDPRGNIYYQAIQFELMTTAEGDTFVEATRGWLIKTDMLGNYQSALFDQLVLNAPPPEGPCPYSFSTAYDALPWPPSPNEKPRYGRCGAQRPALNAAPAVGPDGTVYVISRAARTGRAGFLAAVNPDLTPKWSASFQNHLEDGCNAGALPKNGEPGGCRPGAATGVDPATNSKPAGLVIDSSTSSPVVTPDGSILYGTYTRYNYARGHLFHFNADGSLRAVFDFGWDITPGIFARPGEGYSVVIKENDYDTGSYCGDADFCPPKPAGPFEITQLSADLAPEWSYRLSNNMSCIRGEDGEVSCVSDHPNGFEWCINAPAIDVNGTVYANGEDGVLYAIRQGGQGVQSIFLGEALGAAYTPLALDEKGRIYTVNAGRLFIVGE